MELVQKGDEFSGAVFSSCEKYRYALWRSFGSLFDEPTSDFVVIGLNPSTATESLDDPTIRRCIGFAKRFGCTRYVMLNAYGFRATDPRDMMRADNPIGAHNDSVIAEYVNKARHVVAAWGVHCEQSRANRIAEIVGARLECFGLNSGGSPKHPLYLRADSALVRWK